MSTPAPSVQLYRQVRAAFILQGTSLEAWCKARRKHSSVVKNALVGSLDSPAARKLRKEVIAAADPLPEAA